MYVEAKQLQSSPAARTRRAIVLAYEAPYVPLPRQSDGAEEISLQCAAARLILGDQAVRWHAWAAAQYPEHLQGDTAKHLAGTCRMYVGDLDGAERLLSEALLLREQSGDLQRQASTITNLAEIALRRGDFLRAWALLKRALRHDPALPPVHINRVCLARRAKSITWRREAIQQLRLYIPRWKDDGFLAARVATHGAHSACMR